jgi:hypothetical protein
MIKTKPVKPCKDCKEDFKRFDTMQTRCTPCLIKHGRGLQKKTARKELKEYKEKNKSYNQRIKDAWTPCSKWVRLVRDVNEPCISCGRYDHEIKEHLRGGKFDAGHYLGKAAHPELRFHPDNIHKQCKSCNGGAGQYAKKNHTVTQAYRINLIAKIGIDMVNYLEGHHVAQNWTHDDLIDIKSWYRGLL